MYNGYKSQTISQYLKENIYIFTIINLVSTPGLLLVIIIAVN